MASLIIDWYGASATPPYKALVLIPQDYDYLTLQSGSAPNGVWVLDTMAFWQDLKNIEEGEEGIAFPNLQAHLANYTVGGATYADAVFMECEVSFYNSVADEDWTVILEGSNNNLFDVEAGVYVPSKGTGHLTLIPSNAAGLIIAETGTSGLTPAESQALLDIDTNVDDLTTDVAALEAKIDTLITAQYLTNAQAAAERVTDPITGKLVLRNWDTVERWEADIWEDVAMTIRYKGEGLEAVSQLESVAWPHLTLAPASGGTFVVYDTEAGNGDIAFPTETDVSHMTEITDGSDSTWVNGILVGAAGASYTSLRLPTFTPDTFAGHKLFIRLKSPNVDAEEVPTPEVNITAISMSSLGGTEPDLIMPASTDTEWRDVETDVSVALATEVASLGADIVMLSFNGSPYTGTHEYKLARMEYRYPNMTTDLWP